MCAEHSRAFVRAAPRERVRRCPLRSRPVSLRLGCGVPTSQIKAPHTTFYPRFELADYSRKVQIDGNGKLLHFLGLVSDTCVLQKRIQRRAQVDTLWDAT